MNSGTLSYTRNNGWICEDALKIMLAHVIMIV